MCNIRREMFMMNNKNLDIEEPDEDFNDDEDPLVEFGYEPT